MQGRLHGAAAPLFHETTRFVAVRCLLGGRDLRPAVVETTALRFDDHIFRLIN